MDDSCLPWAMPNAGELAAARLGEQIAQPLSLLAMNKPQEEPRDYRRTLLLVIAIGLLLVCAIVSWRVEQSGSTKLITAATGRIGLLLCAFVAGLAVVAAAGPMVAPGVAVLGVLTLVVLAAQPRLFVVAIPAFCGLLALATFIRAIKG